jgi:hypothetical protein
MTRVKKEKKQKLVEPYWQDFIAAYFEFTKSKFTVAPSFEGSAPRDLKAIIQTLRKRAQEAGIEWTKETAIHRFTLFLQYAFSDWWLSENWLLQNINRQKDKIIFKAAKQRNEVQ